MSKLFCHLVAHIDYDFRIDEIAQYIVDYFSSYITSSSLIYIMDPFLLPYEGIYEPIISKSYDSQLFVKVMKDLHDLDSNICFKIITKKDLKTLNAQLPKTSKISNDYANFFLKNTTGKIEILFYPSKDLRTPNKLHDRWILVNNAGAFVGLHLGPSLNDFAGKDYTITAFANNIAPEIGQRFEYLWNTRGIL